MQYNVSGHYIGIALVLFSSLCYAVLNCVFKHLSHEIPALTMVFYRNVFTAIVLLPVALRLKINFKTLLRKETLLINLVRGSVGFVGICFWILAIAKMPITECVAISFTTPIFITLMGMVIFNEKVHKLKWVAIFTAFIGAMIVVSPNLSNISFYALLVVCASLLWATGAIIVKSFVKDNHPVPIIIFMAILSIILSSPSVIQDAYYPSMGQFFLIFLSAVLSAVAQICMGFAYKKAPITFIIPFDFMRLVFASIIAYVFFNELMKASTLIGSIIIVGSALSIALIDKNTQHNK
jgi:drug/metabolite transporter (DMT)-like permease